MRIMRKLIIFVFLIVFGLGGGYLYMKKQAAKSGQVNKQGAQQGKLEQKRGNTTLSGTVIEQGGEFYLNQAGEDPAHVDSYSLDLSNYAGEQVTVTGQYSGDTLFVKEITIGQ